MNLLVEYQYFSPVYLFFILNKAKNIIFEEYESFQKMSFRNRCIIAGGQGPVHLTIPILGGRDQKKWIKEIRIDYKTNWQTQHWRGIQSSYRRSPWFEHYAADLEEFYSQKPEFLWDWNLKSFEWLMARTKINSRIERTIEYKKSYPNEEIIDLRNKIFPGNYLSFTSPVYQQVFADKTGFQPNLSMIDLLFCEGPNANSFLQL
jgi:hypothetical protein